MPRRISDYPDAFSGWNLVSSIGSIVSLISAALFLYVVYIQLVGGEVVGRNPWISLPFYTDRLQGELSRNSPSLEWSLSSPPKPHAFISLPLQSKIGLNSLKKHFTIKKVVSGIIMVILFYSLRSYLNDFILIVNNLEGTTYEFFFPKELTCSTLCVVIKLILQGVIDDSLNEMPATGIGADLFKGSDEAASGQASGSGEASGSGQASGSGVAYGSSKGEAGSGENSDYDKNEKKSDSDPSPHGDEINDLIYSDDNNLIDQPKKTLDQVRERLKFMKDSYIKRPVPASEGQIKFVDRKDKVCLKELAKTESEEE
jgi:hypothetical protein